MCGSDDGVGLGLCFKNPFQAGGLGLSGIGGQTSGSAPELFSSLELSLSLLLIIFIIYLPRNLPAISRQHYLCWQCIYIIYIYIYVIIYINTPCFSLFGDDLMLPSEAKSLCCWFRLILLEGCGGIFLREADLGPQLTQAAGAVKTAFLGCECTCLPVRRRPCLESSGTGKACLFQENPQISVTNILIF